MTNLFILIGVVLVAVMALFYITSTIIEDDEEFNYFAEDEDDF